MFDLIIREAQIVDGTGTEPRPAEIGVIGDRIVAVGDLAGAEAREEIRCPGRYVTPGFIDTHVHSDLILLANPDHLPKVSQGITTEILGQDGLSYAPLSRTNLARMRRYLAGLNGNPPIRAIWRSVSEYLSQFDRNVAVNVLYLIPHAALRVEALGWENRAATADELQRMRRLARQAMEQGAAGVSTALTYPPCAFAPTDEMVAICKEVAVHGGTYVTHLRADLGDRFLDPLREALHIGSAAGIPVHISHLGLAPARAGQAGEMLDFLEKARTQGTGLSWDSYPYVAGSGGLYSLLPYWCMEGGPEAMLCRLASAQARNRLRADLSETSYPWDTVRIAGVPEGSPNGSAQGRTLAELSAERAVHPADLIADLLLEEDLAVAIVVFGRTEEDVAEVSCRPWNMVGSDGLLTGRAPHPRTYGSFPRFLRLYVREQGRLNWGEAIRRLTSYPAERFGLADRGVLAPGRTADMVVLDPREIADQATYEDGRRLSLGVEQVWVNGQRVWAQGRTTGAHPGRALRPRG